MYSETRSTRKILSLVVVFASAAAVAMAQTSPNTVMQINGNAANSNLNCSAYGAPCDYWNLLNGSGNNSSAGGIGTGSSAGHSLVRTFINGTASTNSYTGGGSKDPADLSSWKWSGSPTPNKDTFNAGYAAAYVASADNSFHLMFGADRVSPSGDANIGIWFFQNSVSLNSNGSFNGLHKNGDIFVISAFTGGGGNSNIQILNWDSSCTSGSSKAIAGQCADTNLRLIAVQASTASCNSSPYCAVTNSVTTDTSWEGNLASPLFFQGGVNLSFALGGGSLPCFSTFLEETRSSQSTSAVLKDFLLGGFPVCSLSITKACDTANPPTLVNNGTQVLYSWKGTVTNTGVGTLSNVEVVDTLPTGSVVNPALTIGGSTVTSLAAGATASYVATATVGTLTATNTATAKGFFGTTEIDSSAPAASASCSISPSSAISVVKSCVAPGPALACSGTGCVVQVPIKAHVCNMGSVRLTGITLADNPATLSVLSTIPLLNPVGTADGSDCASVTGSTQPTAFDASSDGATNGRYSFTDTISIISATPVLGPPITPIGGMCPAGALACSAASCPLCSAGECSATTLQ
jgi:hypothetical protein